MLVLSRKNVKAPPRSASQECESAAQVGVAVARSVFVGVIAVLLRRSPPLGSSVEMGRGPAVGTSTEK